MKNLLAILPVLVAFNVNAQTRLNGLNLTQVDAMYRSQHVSNVSYELDFDLRGEKNYSGSNLINFDLSKVPQFLTLDFVEGDVKKLVLNGSDIDAASHNGSLIL